MTNNSFTDNRQALTQILGILDAIAAKKASGETIIARRNKQTITSEHDKLLGERAKMLNDKATASFQEGRYNEVQRYLKEVLDIIDQLPVNDDHKEAKTYMLNMLAGAECRQGLFEKSVKHLKEAIAICEQLPATIKYQYDKETFEENLEEVEYKMKLATEVNSEQEKASDESLLDAMQNKSSKDKKYKNPKGIESNYRFTNEKPKSRSFSEWCKENVDWIIIAFCILTILICIFC